MAQLEKFKPIFMAVGAILILWAVYTFGGSIDLTASAVQRAEEIEAKTAEIERTVIAEIERLNKVELDARLFESPGFQSLKDWSVPLGEPELGRTNPFAPLSSAGE